MKICNIVPEVVIQTIPKGKNCRKESGYLRRIYKAEERREMKGKGERKRYSQLNAGFRRKARRDKNAFLSEKHKEIEDENRMGKTRKLFKKTGDIKGMFHAKMSVIKDQNSKDVSEVEEIKKRWKEYTEELYKMVLMTQITIVWSLT